MEWSEWSGSVSEEVGAEAVVKPQLVRGLSAHTVTDIVLDKDYDGEAALFQEH